MTKMFIRILVALISSVPLVLEAQGTCTAGWSYFGVTAFHCPGGACSFTPARLDSPAAFSFTVEPRLRGIDPQGPAAGRIDEGDVLLSVNDIFIVTPAAGSALAKLDTSVDARLKLRRNGVLLDVSVRPRQRCVAPLMLAGSSLTMRAARTEGAIAAFPEATIDLTGSSGTPSSASALGMVLRCRACSFEVKDGDARWIVRVWPAIEQLVPGGIAQRAGLRVGDEIARVNGQDVRSAEGTVLLLTPPRQDFRLEYRRGEEWKVTRINARVVERTVVRDARAIRIVDRKVSDGDDDGPIDALVRWWRGFGGGTRDADQRTAVSGTSWGPEGLGFMLTASSQAFIVDDNAGAIRLRRAPVVASVDANSPAANAGLNRNDVITHIDDLDVTTVAGTRALLLANGTRSVRLTYRRDTRDGPVFNTTLKATNQR